jgi:hypothetical protein
VGGKVELLSLDYLVGLCAKAGIEPFSYDARWLRIAVRACTIQEHPQYPSFPCIFSALHHGSGVGEGTIIVPPSNAGGADRC